MAIDRATRSFWLLQLAAWGFYGLATFLTFLTSVDPSGWWGLFLFKAVARPAAGVTVSSVLALFYRRLDEGGRSGPTIAAGAVLGSLLAAPAWYALAQVLIRPARPAGPLIAGPAPHALLEYVFVLLAWSAAFFGVRAWRRSGERERQALEAEARATDARLRALTGQLNPHFLFNALSSLRGLVRRDPERAESVITRLAAFLRYALVRPRRPEVSLGEEIDFIEAYLDVERTRLGNALEAEIEVEADAAAAAVPPFLLQPLVENALKHAPRESDESPRLVLRARHDGERLRVEIANPGTLSPGSREGTGIGLENLRERLEHYYADRHVLELREEDGWVRARLEIPTGGRGGTEDS